MNGTGYLALWAACVLVISALRIVMPAALLAIPFLGCIGMIAWGLVRIMRSRKASTTT